jgi:hypothetical protein
VTDHRVIHLGGTAFVSSLSLLCPPVTESLSNTVNASSDGPELAQASSKYAWDKPTSRAQHNRTEVHEHSQNEDVLVTQLSRDACIMVLVQLGPNSS